MRSISSYWAYFLIFIAIYIPFEVNGAVPLFLEVNEDLSVYAKPHKGRPVLTLQAGQSVQVSNKRYGNGRFLRVIISYKGKERGGYVAIKSIRLSKIQLPEKQIEYRKVSTKTEESVEDLRGAAYGLLFGAQIFQQKAGQLESGGVVFDFGKLSGKSFPAAVFLDFPMSSNSNLKTFLSYRKLDIDGDVAVEGGTSTPFVKEQTMVSLGVLGRFYLSPTSRFWYGIGWEGAKVLSSVTTVEGADPEEKETDEIPLKIIAALSFGYDISLAREWQLVPELSASYVFNDDPTSYAVQLLISLRNSL